MPITYVGPLGVQLQPKGNSMLKPKTCSFHTGHRHGNLLRQTYSVFSSKVPSTGTYQTHIIKSCELGDHVSGDGSRAIFVWANIRTSTVLVRPYQPVWTLHARLCRPVCTLGAGVRTTRASACAGARGLYICSDGLLGSTESARPPGSVVCICSHRRQRACPSVSGAALAVTHVY